MAVLPVHHDGGEKGPALRGIREGEGRDIMGKAQNPARGFIHRHRHGIRHVRPAQEDAAERIFVKGFQENLPVQGGLVVQMKNFGQVLKHEGPDQHENASLRALVHQL